MKQTFIPLTSKNIKVGSIIRRISSPNTTHRVTKHYDTNIWEIGDTVVFESDFKFWEIRTDTVNN